MSDNEGGGDGFLSPSIPIIDVEISAADAGAVDFNEDI